MKSISLPSSFSLYAPIIQQIAFIIWILLVSLYIGLFLIGHYVDFHKMLEPCYTQWVLNENECYWLSLSLEEVSVLKSWGGTLQQYAIIQLIPSIILLIVYVSLGIVILWRTGISRIGLLISLILMSMPYAVNGTQVPWIDIHPYLIIPNIIATQSAFTLNVAFLYLIPNGRFSPKWAYVPFSLIIVLSFITPVVDDRISYFPSEASILLFVFMLGLFGVCLQIYRYFYDLTPVERQQMRWITLALILYFLGIIIWILVFGRVIDIESGRERLLINVISHYLSMGMITIIPFAIASAILRYKLWNIDIIINRTLVFGGLSALVVLVYTLIVGGTSLLFQSSSNVFISFTATALIVVVFQPARDRLQRAVNRLMFGERDNPYLVLSRLGQQLKSTAVPSETLKSIVETIATTLKLPYVAIELLEQDTLVERIDYGISAFETVRLPLHYQTETVGRLIVSPRASNEDFQPQEEQLLATISAQIAPVVSATRLTLALQQSRENLVLAREEERRRIRRDLHDGLGPTLASQTLQLDAVLDLLIENDPYTAGKKVEQIKSQMQEMVTDIRRLVYELRPPALDELGLLEALRAHVAQMNGTQNLRISIASTPEPLPSLPAAIEVAAYRIVLEAVTNVIRHAQAQSCHIQFAVAVDIQLSTLQLTVTDDGVGLPLQLQSGVGLASMRERTAELGGTLTIDSTQRVGTRLTAMLPFVTKG